MSTPVETTSSVLKRLLSHSAVYWVGTLLTKMIGFFLIPLYTRYLHPADYGTLELLVLTVDIISLFIGLQLAAAVARFYDGADGISNKNKVVSTAIILLLLLGGAVFSSLILFSDNISYMVFGHKEHQILFQIVFAAAFFGIIMQIPLLLLRILDKSKQFVIITLVQVLLTVSLTIYFVVELELGVLGIVSANAIITTLLCGYLLATTLAKIGFKFSYHYTCKMVSYSAPLIPAVLGMFVLHFSDRFFLNSFSTLEELGIYALAYKFGFLLAPLLIQPFGLVWGPKMFEIYRLENSHEIIHKIFHGYAFLAITTFFVLSLFIKEILIIMTTPQYYMAASLVPVIALAYALNAINRLIMTPFYTEDKTKFIGYINSVAAVVCIILNIILIKPFGAMGAAVATLLSFGFILAMNAYFSTKVSSLRWPWSSLIKIISITIALLIVAELVKIDSMMLSIAFKGFIFIIFLSLIYFSNYFNKSDIKAVVYKIRIKVQR